jgi:hypothetical protein
MAPLWRASDALRDKAALEAADALRDKAVEPIDGFRDRPGEEWDGE